MKAVRMCLFGSSLLALIGCGESTGELTGTVTFSGKPVRMGTVNVAAKDGRVVSGSINDDGTYTVVGIPTGSAKVVVSSPNPATNKAHMRKKGEAAPVEDNSKWAAIPDKYGDLKTTDLTTTVNAGKNTYNIELN